MLLFIIGLFIGYFHKEIIAFLSKIHKFFQEQNKRGPDNENRMWD